MKGVKSMMRELPGKERSRSMTELLLMLVLLAVFAVSALVIVMTGAGVYQSIAEDQKANADLRIPLTYVTNKIRQADASGQVRLLEQEGTAVLVLSHQEEQQAYDTWIYALEGQLCEVTVASGSTLRLADGIAVMPVPSFEIRWDGPRMLLLTAGDASGQALSTRVALRSHPGAPAASHPGAPAASQTSQEVPIL